MFVLHMQALPSLQQISYHEGHHPHVIATFGSSARFQCSTVRSRVCFQWYLLRRCLLRRGSMKRVLMVVQMRELVSNFCMTMQAVCANESFTRTRACDFRKIWRNGPRWPHVQNTPLWYLFSRSRTEPIDVRKCDILTRSRYTERRGWRGVGTSLPCHSQSSAPFWKGYVGGPNRACPMQAPYNYSQRD